MSASLPFLVGTDSTLAGALRTSGSSSASTSTGSALAFLGLVALTSAMASASSSSSILPIGRLPSIAKGAGAVTPSAAAGVTETARSASLDLACSCTISYSSSVNQRSGAKISLGDSALVSNFMRVTIKSRLTGGVCAAIARAYACSGRLSPSSLPKMDVAGSVTCKTSPSGLLASTTAKRCW